MSSEFRDQLEDEYIRDCQWELLYDLPKAGKNENLQFELDNRTIYFLDQPKRRLCIPKGLMKVIFEMVHDQ